MKRSINPLAFLGATALLATVIACSTKDTASDSAAAVAARAPAAPPPAVSAPADSAANNGFLDPNTATAAQLTSIPGIDSATAAALVAGRPYANMTAVDKVLPARVTDVQRDTIYTRLWKPIDLNTASDVEIQLIPGVGPMLLHEFKEYRIYPSIEKFRREIGKYVDKKEVARLERYVSIR
jgi:DNA uptake protein ComE-like DNA-binding protein